MWGGRDRGELGEVLARVQLEASPKTPAHLHCLPAAWMDLWQGKTIDKQKMFYKSRFIVLFISRFSSQVWRGWVKKAEQTSN